MANPKMRPTVPLRDEGTGGQAGAANLGLMAEVVFDRLGDSFH